MIKVHTSEHTLFRKVVAPVGTVLLLGLGACGKSGEVQFTFDDLGGGDPEILVYAGPSETAADRTPIGKYRDGDTVTAICKTAGRTVFSNPEVDEAEQASNIWVKFEDRGREAYATATYSSTSPADFERIPLCPSVELSTVVA